MEDYKKLVNRLRDEPKDSRKAVLSIYDLCIDAAYAIEILLDKLKYAEGERDAVTRHMIELEQEVCQLKSRLAAYEDTGLEPQDIISAVDMAKIACALHELNAYKDIGPIDHIRDILQAEQEGRLVVLPAKTVWELTMDSGPDCDLKCPVDAYDEALGCDLCSKAKQFAYERPCTQDLLKELGKTVFLTREDAEAAMAQEGGTDEDSGSL